MIIHVLPENYSPCGGIKVHYEMCELEREMGINSIISFPSSERFPSWMERRNVGRIMNYREARELGYLELKKGKDVLVIGWEDKDVLDVEFSSFTRSCYIQGDVYWRGFPYYEGKHIFTNSEYVKSKIKKEVPVVTPYINSKIFFPSRKVKFGKYPHKVLIQGRKGGKEALQKILSYREEGFYKGRIQFELVGDMGEKEFGSRLRDSDIFLSHSFPEGLGLPPLEAMSSKTLVIGFSGGGGSEYMKNGENCFYTEDGRYEKVTDILDHVLRMSREEIEVVVLNGYKTSQSFNKENTKKQLLEFLDSVSNGNL